MWGALRAHYETLSPREREVYAGIVAGKLNKQIAADLGTAERTIKAHRAQAMEKMAVGSVAELVHLADELGGAAGPSGRSGGNVHFPSPEECQGRNAGLAPTPLLASLAFPHPPLLPTCTKGQYDYAPRSNSPRSPPGRSLAGVFGVEIRAQHENTSDAGTRDRGNRGRGR